MMPRFPEIIATSDRVLRLAIPLSLVILLVGLSGCATGPIRNPEKQDITTGWNDHDSRETAAAMIQDCLSRGWLDVFKEETGSRPRVVIGRVKNKTMEHLNTSTFVKSLKKELTNSGRVRFVAASEIQAQLDGYITAQRDRSSAETLKSLGNAIAADFMLVGTIEQIVDAAGGEELVYFQVTLELFGIESNELAWIGEHEIRKYERRGAFRR